MKQLYFNLKVKIRIHQKRNLYFDEFYKLFSQKIQKVQLFLRAIFATKEQASHLFKLYIHLEEA